MGGTERAGPRLQRVLEKLARPRPLALREVHAPEREVRLRHRQMVGTEQAAAHGEGVLEERAAFRVAAQAVIQVADEQQHLGLHRGLGHEILGLDALGAPGQGSRAR